VEIEVPLPEAELHEASLTGSSLYEPFIDVAAGALVVRPHATTLWGRTFGWTLEPATGAGLRPPCSAENVGLLVVAK
jgi:hypothetical protein